MNIQIQPIIKGIRWEIDALRDAMERIPDPVERQRLKEEILARENAIRAFENMANTGRAL